MSHQDIRAAVEARRAQGSATKARVEEALPGYGSQIAQRLEVSPATITRVLRALVAEGRAYQSGWVKASRWVPVYERGPPPDGFKLPPMPRGDKNARERERKRALKDRPVKWTGLLKQLTGGSK